MSYAHDNSPSPLPESMNIPKYSPFGITIGEKFEDITYKDHKRSKEIKVKPPKPSRELFDEYYIQVNSDDSVYNISAAADYSSNPRTFTCKEAVAFLKRMQFAFSVIHSRVKNCDFVS